MNCNCTKACSIPYCITELEIGIVGAGLSGLIVEFKDVITGRIKKLSDIAPQSDGLLIVDVTSISAFFSPNFMYEIRVLFSDESSCQAVPVTIGDQSVECVSVEFVNGVATRGVIVLEGQVSQYMQLVGNFNSTLSFVSTFSGGVFVIDWGDGSFNVVYSGVSNEHTYAPVGEYTAKIRGDFSIISAISTGNAGTDLANVVMPPVNSFTSVILRTNNLPTSVINNILVNLDNNGLTNGVVSLQLQTPSAPPTFQGAAAATNLQSKGWTVTTD